MQRTTIGTLLRILRLHSQICLLHQPILDKIVRTKGVPRFFLMPVLLAALLISPSSVLQAQDLEWVNTTLGGAAIAADEDGNSYVTGGFTEVVIPGEEEDPILLRKVSVEKYGPDGTLLWATSAGHIKHEGLDGRMFASGIAIDAEGNSYAVGSFNGTAVFGAGEPHETVLTFPVGGGDDATFIAKYAPDGTLEWATIVAGGFILLSSGVATDASGNSYVIGSFEEATTFGPGDPNKITLTPVGIRDLFVAKYDADGNLLWVTTAADQRPEAIASGPTGEIYVTGTRADGTEIFIASYGPDGTLLWFRTAGPVPSGIRSQGIAADAQGNSYIAGSFSGTAVFGAVETNETTLVAASTADLDIFVAKFGPDGGFLWATSAGGAEVDFGQGIAADLLGNSYVTGRFRGTAIFGAGETNGTVLIEASTTESQRDDLFVAKYAPDGTLLWATSAVGSARDSGNGIATDGTAAYVTGQFGFDSDGNASITFGAGEPNETVLTGTGRFIAKYRDAVEDSDGDGVADTADFCPGTVLPEIVPTSGRLLPYRYAITDQGPAFSTGEFLPWQGIFPPFLHEIFARQGAKRPRPSFTIFDTQGCSCEQIIDALRLGPSHRRFGCNLIAMRTFIRRLPK